MRLARGRRIERHDEGCHQVGVCFSERNASAEVKEIIAHVQTGQPRMQIASEKFSHSSIIVSIIGLMPQASQHPRL